MMSHQLKILFFLMIATPLFSFNDAAYSTEMKKHKSPKKDECTLWSKGEQKLSLWANVRFRYENQDYFNAKAYGDQPVAGEITDEFMLGRFRLGLKYDPSKYISFSLGGQHCEVWGLAYNANDFYKDKLESVHNPYEEDLEPFDTFLELKLLANSLKMKFGRQRIFYGNKRIFGPGQWGNTGRWIWDAAKVSYKFDLGFVDAYYGRTMIHDPEEFSLDHGHAFESIGLYSSFKIDKFAVEPFAMTKDNDRDTYKGEDGVFGDLESYYAGIRLFGKDIAGFDIDCTYIMQDGDYGSDEIEAYGYHALLAYNFNKLPCKPRPSIEYSYASGDSDPTDGKHETFDSAFGARDKMYGRINLFHWMNLKDAQVNLEFKPAKMMKITLGFHQFWLAEEKDAWYLNAKKYRDKTGSSGDEVGKEFDLVGVINLPKKNQIQFGYGHFWPDEFTKNITKSDKEANWIFVQWMVSL